MSATRTRNRRSTGGVVVDERGASPRYGLRFRAMGRRRYVTLGSAAEGWTRERAEVELQNVLADVRRGIWQAPNRDAPIVPERPQDPTFHAFSSEWFEANKGAWRPNTRAAYQWELSNHLLPRFAQYPLSQITVEEVDRYRQFKQREGMLSAESINKTLTRLGRSSTSPWSTGTSSVTRCA